MRASVRLRPRSDDDVKRAPENIAQQGFWEEEPQVREASREETERRAKRALRRRGGACGQLRASYLEKEERKEEQ